MNFARQPPIDLPANFAGSLMLRDFDDLILET
jgi:hypothetical protein